jgi:hypothetical protein
VNVGTVVAICSILIASMALIVSILEARAARRYNECSVRPLLEISYRRDAGWAGIHLVNYGLGPAVVENTVLAVDGSIKGKWETADIEKILPDHHILWPVVTSLRDGRVIGVGYDSPLYGLKDYDSFEGDRGFWRLICDRVYLEIHYRSLYGERFVATIGSRQAPALINRGKSEISNINDKPTVGDVQPDSSAPQPKPIKPDPHPA